MEAPNRDQAKDQPDFSEAANHYNSYARLPDLGNPMYLSLLEYARTLHIQKAAGYSGGDQPDVWSNFREAEGWGYSPLAGCVIRLGDKYRRAQNVFRDSRNDMVGEPFIRTLIDASAYSLIAICLWAEERGLSWPEVEKILTDGEA